MFFDKGHRGRPEVHISREQLETFYNANYKGTQMAKQFSCCNNVVYKRLKEEGFSLKGRYSLEGDDDALDEKTKDIHNAFPNAGSKVNMVYVIELYLVLWTYGPIDM